MAKVKISDESIWTKHIEGDSKLKERVLGLKAGELLDLEVDGVVGRWERMKDGKDGRPTFGIKPVDAMRQVWAHMRKQTGRIIEVREVLVADSYLAALSSTMDEWNSPEDEIAYRDL